MLKRRCAGRGFLIGLISGAAASWVMNQFFVVQGKLQELVRPDAEREQLEHQQENRDEDDPTVNIAEVIVRDVFHQSLDPSKKKLAGSIVHYVYGTLMGGLYGAIAELEPESTVGFGTGYATALWLAGDEFAFPVLGLSKSPSEYPLSQHLSGLCAHLVYGLSAEGVRRVLRKAS